MTKYLDTVVISSGPVRDGPGTHGKDIGYVYSGVSLQVLIDDPESPHDAWVQIIAPKPDPVRLDGTWKNTEAIGWIEYSHLRPIIANERQYLMTLNEDGSVKSCVRVR